MSGNLAACSVWFVGVYFLHLYGIRPEELLGNLGAVGEASAIGMNTTFATYLAKRITYYNVAIAPKNDMSTSNLLNLAREYNSKEMLKRLSDERSSKFFDYDNHGLISGSHPIAATVAGNVAEVAKTIRRFYNLCRNQNN